MMRPLVEKATTPSTSTISVNKHDGIIINNVSS